MRRSCAGFQDRWATICPYPPFGLVADFGGWSPSRTVSSAFQADSVTRPDPTSHIKKLEARRRIELRVNRFAGGAVTVSLRAWYPRRASNPHAEALVPKTSVSAYSTTRAKI
jgi:hypothetical protein